MSLVLAVLPYIAPTLDPTLATEVEVAITVVALVFLLWVTIASVMQGRDRPLSARASTLVGLLFAMVVLTIALERATTWIG